MTQHPEIATETPKAREEAQAIAPSLGEAKATAPARGEAPTTALKAVQTPASEGAINQADHAQASGAEVWAEWPEVRDLLARHPEWPQVSPEAARAILAMRRHFQALPPERRPKVCISSITYNHEPFIAQALEGFLMQQTDFPFVAVVHDDASTDRTAHIIRRYAALHPGVIFPIYETENQYRKPGGPLSLIMHLARLATGAPYIAMCEGDDYWTSPRKLQLQATFLDSHPTYVMTSHNYREYFQDKGEYGEPIGRVTQDFTLQSYIYFKDWIYLTLTMMYRMSAFDIQHYMRYADRRDLVLIYHLLTKGNGLFLSEDLGVYRRHIGGVWTGVLMSQSQKKNRDRAFLIDFRVRQSLHDVEQTEESAQFLFNHVIGRYYGRVNTIRYHLKYLGKAYLEVMRIKGPLATTKMVFDYFLFNKTGFQKYNQS